MSKIGLFLKYNNEDIKGLKKGLCFQSKINKKIQVYSRNTVTIFEEKGFYILVTARSGEAELTIKNLKLPQDKILLYHYNSDKKYFDYLKKTYPNIKIISAQDHKNLVVEITEEGFKWKKYDNISLPKPNKDSKGDKPTP